MVSVDGGQTAGYVFDALNQRVRVQTPSSTLEYTYDFAGRRITTWDANANFGVQGQIWCDSQPLAFRSIDNSTYFEGSRLAPDRTAPAVPTMRSSGCTPTRSAAG